MLFKQKIYKFQKSNLNCFMRVFKTSFYTLAKLKINLDTQFGDGKYSKSFLLSNNYYNYGHLNKVTNELDNQGKILLESDDLTYEILTLKDKLKPKSFWLLLL